MSAICALSRTAGAVEAISICARAVGEVFSMSCAAQQEFHAGGCMIGSGFHRCHARPLRRFLGDADGVGAVSHLGPNVTGPNPKFVPEDDKVIEKIGTFQ